MITLTGHLVAPARMITWEPLCRNANARGNAASPTKRRGIEPPRAGRKASTPPMTTATAISAPDEVVLAPA
jgi:hypothetical protein